MSRTTGDLPDLDDEQIEALHSVELGMEWLQRAHGKLIEFHHATGHAMDHLDDAEKVLRDNGYEDLAEELSVDLLPCGAIDDRWTYDLLETFESGMLADVEQFEYRTLDEIADGQSHVAERRQELAWRRRAQRD